MQENCKIIKKSILAAGIFDFWLLCPGMAATAQPGQFLHILCGDKPLRRPISICEINKSGEALRIVFEVRGEGTKWMGEQPEGRSLDVLGPLGRGFDVSGARGGGHAMFVGGGIGVPPLLEAAKAYGKNAGIFLGFKSRETAILIDDFKRFAGEVIIATDDGSMGSRGFITDAVSRNIGQYKTVYACGPLPMLAKTARIAGQNGVPCFVSMEERMGCGVGACLVCACKTKGAGGETYSHVCKDGPVFNAEEVVW